MFSGILYTVASWLALTLHSFISIKGMSYIRICCLTVASLRWKIPMLTFKMSVLAAHSVLVADKIVSSLENSLKLFLATKSKTSTVSFSLTVPFFAHWGWGRAGLSVGRVYKLIPEEERREQEINLAWITVHFLASSWGSAHTCHALFKRGFNIFIQKDKITAKRSMR